MRITFNKSLLFLIGILVAVTYAGIFLTAYQLYNTAIEQERERLVETVQSQARLIEAVAAFDQKYSISSFPGTPEEATLSQIVKAHTEYEGFGKTSEFTLAKRVDSQIIFLLRHRNQPLKNIPSPEGGFFLGGELAVPMQKALTGQSGTVVATDYRGATVLAAYEPVSVLNYGIVAKIDMQEIQQPFISAVGSSVLLGSILAVLGSLSFRSLINPILQRIELEKRKFGMLLDSTSEAIYGIDLKGNATFVNPTCLSLLGYDSADELLGRNMHAAIHHHHENGDPYPLEQCQIVKAFSESKSVEVDSEVFWKKDGSAFHVEYRSSPIFEAEKCVGAVVSFVDITQRRMLERSLVENERKYRLLAENMPDMVYQMSLPDGKYHYVSPSAENIFGVTAAVWYENPILISELIHSDWQDYFKREWQVLITEGSTEVYEYQINHPENGVRWLNQRNSITRDADGMPVMITGVVTDITSQKELEHEVASNEERLSLALRSANQGLYDLNVQTGEAVVNDEYATMLGYDPKTFHETNAKWLERLHPDDVERVGQVYLDYIGGKSEEYRVEFRQKRKSGDWIWILSIGRIVDWLQDGQPLRMLGTHTDITKLKDAQEKVRQAAQVFSSTIEGVTITDTNGTILDVNDAFCEITGYSRDEVIGNNPRVLKSGRHKREFYDEMWHSLTTTGAWRGEIWNKRKDGIVYPEMLTISRVTDENQVPTGYVAVFTDITEAKKTEERLEFLAHHDPLTRLPNRYLLNAYLERLLKSSARDDEKLAVVFIDIDRFKQINDNFGHASGDELLKQCASRITKSIRAGDIVSRISGDEFVVLLENVGGSGNVSLIVRKIIEKFNEPFYLNKQEVAATCSIGISLFPDDGNDVSKLLGFADTAMYRAKNDGRNDYQFYTPEMTSAATEQLFMESALKKALQENQFSLVYQPQLHLGSEALIGFEALIRWYHPEQGMIGPNHFIPFAEKTGLIQKIGEWVLNEACCQAREWLKGNIQFGKIAVNISGRQVQHPNFADRVVELLEAHQLDPVYLELEVTESFLMDHEETAIGQLRELQKLGITVAIDDFGTGYSSMSYLKNLPINKLKIDQSFVHDIPHDNNDMAISSAVIALGNAMELQVIGEGVETLEQIAFLKEKGCQYGQGYYFSRPLNAEDVALYIKKGLPEQSA
ncbi:MAG: EAL domain-containing protein [Candidatus Thiodiazotropha taylori]